MALAAVEFQAFGKYRQEVVAKLKEALAEAEKQEWQSLSDGEIGKVLDDLDIGAAHTDWMINFAYAIEAKLKEKNKC